MDSRIGGISRQEIEDLSSSLPDLTQAGSSAETRFSANVVKLIRVRADKGETGGVAVFLCANTQLTDVKGVKTVQKSLLGMGNEPILNAAWLTDVAIGSALQAIEMNLSDPDTLHSQITKMGLAALPAIIVDWRSSAPRIRFFPMGVTQSSVTIDIILDDDPLTASAVRDCLDNFHDTTLRTPLLIASGHGQKIWGNASKGVPLERPEERIQGRLLDHLRAKFSAHHIRAEQDTKLGRYDLQISRHFENQDGKKYTVNEWLLELKALCDKTSSGKKTGSPKSYNDALSNGITQADEYKKSENALNAALCCYDMREKDDGDQSCFSSVKSQGSKCAVHLWRWYLARSSSAARKASAAGR